MRFMVAMIVLSLGLVALAEDEPTTRPATQPATQPTTQRTTESGLKITVLAEGKGDRLAQAGDRVAVHYIGRLTDGTVFDSSVARGRPFEFPLGAGRVIKGWDEGVAGMKMGEKRLLVIPPHLGYGARGAGGVIPPNATLEFKVELLEIR